jgi:hypothetical protein
MSGLRGLRAAARNSGAASVPFVRAVCLCTFVERLLCAQRRRSASDAMGEAERASGIFLLQIEGFRSECPKLHSPQTMHSGTVDGGRRKTAPGPIPG